MGSGKSTIGHRLAKKLSLPFYDTDQRIEARLGVSVSDIFAYEGEAYFRRMEDTVMRELVDSPPSVIGTGGGLYMQDALRQLINARTISIWLQAPLDVLVERVSRRHTRPLLEQGDKHSILSNLLATREPFYRQAHLHIDSAAGSHAAIVHTIIRQLKEHVSRIPSDASTHAD